MPNNSPIDDNIPRDPDRGRDQDNHGALRTPENLDGSRSLHSTHAHSKASIDSPSSVDTKHTDPLPTPRCVLCGYDRTGLESHDTCPECARNHTPPQCTFCDYELSGLLVTQNCPECGKPIWDSNIQPPTSGLAITSLVLGIVSLATCIFYGVPALILGPLAIIFGEIANRQFKNGTRAGNTKGFAFTGRICGWAGFAIGATITVLFIFMILNF